MMISCWESFSHGLEFDFPLDLLCRQAPGDGFYAAGLSLLHLKAVQKIRYRIEQIGYL